MSLPLIIRQLKQDISVNRNMSQEYDNGKRNRFKHGVKSEGCLSPGKRFHTFLTIC